MLLHCAKTKYKYSATNQDSVHFIFTIHVNLFAPLILIPCAHSILYYIIHDTICRYFVQDG